MVVGRIEGHPICKVLRMDSTPGRGLFSRFCFPKAIKRTWSRGRIKQPVKFYEQHDLPFFSGWAAEGLHSSSVEHGAFLLIWRVISSVLTAGPLKLCPFSCFIRGQIKTKTWEGSRHCLYSQNLADLGKGLLGEESGSVRQSTRFLFQVVPRLITWLPVEGNELHGQWKGLS